MSRFQFTPDERDVIVRDLERVLFIDGGLRTRNNVNPLGQVRTRVTRGIVTRMLINLETIIEEHINGVPEAKARKNK